MSKLVLGCTPDPEFADFTTLDGLPVAIVYSLLNHQVVRRWVVGETLREGWHRNHQVTNPGWLGSTPSPNHHKEGSRRERQGNKRRRKIKTKKPISCFLLDMEFLQAHNTETLAVAVAVTVVAIGAGAAYFHLSRKPKGYLDSENFREFELVERKQLSHNVAKFRFALPTPTSVLGLPIGQHISCRGKDGMGEEVIKPYTPTTLDSDVGYFELVIKMYPQGRMSHHFREMRVGDHLSVKGPKGRFRYQPGQVREFGMIAGGSGITPMFQVARAILENPKDNTKVYLIYANVTYEDILLKEELDDLASNYPGRFKIYYVLNQPPENWNAGVGFVSTEMIKNHCPAPAQDIQILRCGPPPMNKAMASHLDELGYSKEMQFQF